MGQKTRSTKRIYDVVLSFAGEDRKYVEQIAIQLQNAGVKVFYDKFEEATLWGKDLYVHLSDVYSKRAHFTVILASRYYKKKLWANHELRSAQARAFESNREYILPTLFDKSVTIPGVLKTIAWISLWDRSPEEVAELIIEKLRGFGIEPTARFDYADEARADVDFPRPKGSPFTKIIDGMKSHTWPVQAPAVRSIFDLDWSTLDKNELFVLGRNVYQCADGSERTAQGILNNLRDKLATIPAEATAHLLNGMLFEVYFDHAGKFRGRNLKCKYLAKLLELQTVKRFAPSISFIHRELQPYKSHLPFLPSVIPEVVTFESVLRKSDHAVLRSLSLKGHELLAKDEADIVFPEQWWTVSLTKFTIKQLTVRLSEKWNIPIAQIKINSNEGVDPETKYQFATDYIIRWPRL